MGREKAGLAAERLRGFTGPVFASPLRRAVETASIIAAILGLGSVEVEKGLQEWDAGEWTGLTSAQIEERYATEFAAWREGNLRRYPGGADRKTHHVTVIAALRRIVESHGGIEVLVVSHAGSIGSIERHLGVHPGRSVRQLEGRWFELGRDVSKTPPVYELTVASERILLLDEGE